MRPPSKFRPIPEEVERAPLAHLRFAQAGELVRPEAAGGDAITRRSKLSARIAEPDVLPRCGPGCTWALTKRGS